MGAPRSREIITNMILDPYESSSQSTIDVQWSMHSFIYLILIFFFLIGALINLLLGGENWYVIHHNGHIDHYDYWISSTFSTRPSYWLIARAQFESTFISLLMLVSCYLISSGRCSMHLPSNLLSLQKICCFPEWWVVQWSYINRCCITRHLELILCFSHVS